MFRTDDVSIADNYIADCAFSAIRLNATNDTLVIGDHCAKERRSVDLIRVRFSGSIISDNLVERGAAGISMTSPEAVPYSIAAGADATVAGNVAESVPGTGIII